jgi:hypothetical protein
MPLDDDAIRDLIDGKSKVTTRVGRYAGNDGNLALVDLGDQRIPVRFATPWVPEINEPVYVDTIDGVSRLVGPTSPKPGMGVVTTVSGDKVNVLTDFGTFSTVWAAYAPDAPSPSSGDTVGIDWSTGPRCYRLSTSPEPVPPPPDPGGGGGRIMSAEFRAVDAGTTHPNGDWWQSQPWAADGNVGAWFYGNTIRDTIPAGAVFESLQIYINRVQRTGDPPNWALHNLPWKDGVPAFGPSTPWHPDGNGWQTPPDPQGWFNALKAGGSAAGIGLNHGGYNKFASRTQDGATGALKITWRY